MYDLHAHILPGIDDGAKTPEETLEMARVAAQHGTEVVLATPHRRDITENWSVPHIRKLLDEMNGLVTSGGIALTLKLGMENHLDLELPADVSMGRALPMDGSRYILVEMPFFGRPNYMEDVLFQLQLQGLTVVLAHPERIEAFQSDPSILVRLVEAGMLTQVTSGSVVGHFGAGVRRFTRRLIAAGLVHVFASDCHTATGPRSPSLTEGLEAVEAMVGRERARAMFIDTPRAVLDDRPVEVDPPDVAALSQPWWRFWRGGH